MKCIKTVKEAQTLLALGKIIAYPTEAVYGLGCDPFNQQAVEALLALKSRAVTQGLIILIADWSQLPPLIGTVSPPRLDAVRETWPGPVTWVFPKSAIIPEWLSGEHDSIAIRMSAKPSLHQLCAHGPIVSTSANITRQPPARDMDGLFAQFPTGIDAVLVGELGHEEKPSAIFDVRTGKQLR